MSFSTVSNHLLTAHDLDEQDLFSVLTQLADRHIDYGDLYFQSSFHEAGCWKIKLSKTALTILTGCRDPRRQRRENRLCLRGSDKPDRITAECLRRPQYCP